MLTSDQLDSLADPVTDLYRRFADSVINDIARRLAGLDMTSTAAWQAQRLSESGMLFDDILKRLAELTNRSEAELRQAFGRAGVKAMRFDDAIYKAAGLQPLPFNLSPAMVDVLAAGLRKTNGILHNLTMTTAISGQNAFVEATDLAYMQVIHGAMDYNSAIRQTVKDVAAKGLTVIKYANGREDQLDVAVRRTVLTGVGQTVGQLQLARADEMGQDLVAVSAHVGARNTGIGPANHESWQGQVYSRSGTHPKYKPFIETTGYGTGAGLMGYNCRHSFYPFFEGISENAYSQAELESYADKTVAYNGQEMSVYEATQQQRYIERKIRYFKRQEGALKAAGLDTTEETAKVREWQGEMRKFVKETGLVRQSERERVIKPVPIESVDRDLRQAHDKKLFSLQSRDTEVVYSKPIDLSGYYGNEQVKSANVTLDQRQKRHVWRQHKSDREWLANNQDLVLKAISRPEYIDKDLRVKDDGALTTAHVIYIGEKDTPYLNVTLSFQEGYAKIWTMYRTHKRHLFENGNLKDRWLKIK